jgi:hypothetical protein
MASTNLAADIVSVYNNGMNAATKAKTVNPNGPLVDYYGVLKSLEVNLKYLSNLAGQVAKVTDATDSANLALLTAIANSVTGGSAPSATAITGIGTVYTNGPNAATIAKAINPNGPIMDYPGNVSLIQLGLKEAAVQAKILVGVTDSTDATNLALLQGIQSTLS